MVGNEPQVLKQEKARRKRRVHQSHLFLSTAVPADACVTVTGRRPRRAGAVDGNFFPWGWWPVPHLTPRCPRDTEGVNTEHPVWLEREPSLVLQQGQGAGLTSYRWEPPDPLATTGQGAPKSLWSG